MKSQVKLVLLLELVTLVSAQFITHQRGKKYSEDPDNLFKLFLKTGAGDIVSLWHDVPLFVSQDTTNNTYNMIVEIPRFSQAKFEISRDIPLNPIIHDQENNKNRYLPNVFPWHGHICNYGAFPQTWENPFIIDQWTGLMGDKDPIDVCELGSNPLSTGAVVQVKVLGILGLLDKSETDWKVIVINAEEAAANNINSLDDLAEIYPDLANTVRDFFRVYKVPAGRPENQFAFNAEFQNVEFAKNVIRNTHEEWKKLLDNCTINDEDVGSFSSVNTGQETDCSIDQRRAEEEVDQYPEYDPHPDPLPDSVKLWNFVRDDQHNSATLTLINILLVVISMLVSGGNTVI